MTRRALLAAAAVPAVAPFLFALGARAGTGSETLAPLLDAPHWLGSRPGAASLRGKVVLVDVFTFGCINCKHVIPSLRALQARAEPDLVVLGVHTPETGYERDAAHVKAAFAAQGVVWPVAIDNDETLWNAYAITAWPTQLIFDRKGRLRSTVIGEGNAAAVAATIAELLAER